jgi:transposase-like protein
MFDGEDSTRAEHRRVKGQARPERRRWPAADKARIVAEAMAPGAVVSAARAGVNRGLRRGDKAAPTCSRASGGEPLALASSGQNSRAQRTAASICSGRRRGGVYGRGDDKAGRRVETGAASLAAARDAHGHFLRRRLAFAIALLCQGFRRASADALFEDDSSRPVSTAAAAFSWTMRRYSAAEQELCAIIKVRRAIVSQDAQASSVIIKGAGTAGRRLRDFMA